MVVATRVKRSVAGEIGTPVYPSLPDHLDQQASDVDVR